MDFEKDHVAPAVLRGPPPHGFRMGPRRVCRPLPIPMPWPVSIDQRRLRPRPQPRPSYDYKCHITLERVHEGETIRIEVAANR